MKLLTTICTAWFLVAGSGMLRAQSGAQAEKLLESARHKEVMEGDLKGAIEQYRKISAQFAKQPEVAARALYQLGQCQEKLGQAEARKSYERIVREYGTEQQYASAARARLAAMGGGAASGETRARLIWDNAIDYWGCVTADGRQLSFIDWSSGDLAVRDLQGGQHRRVTNKGGFEKAEGEAEASCISPDGKRIAFNWQRWDAATKTDGSYQLRVVNSDGTGERLLRQMKPRGYIQSQGWSPDGKWLAVTVEGTIGIEGGDSRIELILPETGESRVIPTQSKLWKDALAFSPDGKWLAYEEPLRAEAGFVSANIFLRPLDGPAGSETQVAQEMKLMGWAPGGKALLLAKNQGETRRLHLLPVSEGRATGEATELHAPTMMGYSSLLGITPKGDLYYGTNNSQIEAWIVRADRASGRWSEPVAKFPVAGIGWANNGGNLRFSPDGTQLAAFVPNQSIAIRKLSDGRQRVITPQLKDYRRFEWTLDGSSFLVSATGEDGRFGLHRVDAVTGAATFLCTMKQGQVFVPAADGKSVFHLGQQGLTSIDLATGIERPLPTRDFARQGPNSMKLSRDGKSLLLTSFAFIGVYDIASGTLREIHNRKEQIGSAAWAADWSADGRQVIAVFRPTIQGQPRELRIYPAEGGAPVTHALPGTIRSLSASADGVHVAAMSANSHMQVWVLENFLPSAAVPKR